MNTEEIFRKHFSDKELILYHGSPCCLNSDGSLTELLDGTPVKILDRATDETSESRNRFYLSHGGDAFWKDLFAYFQRSGFSVQIEDGGVLLIDSLQDLRDNAITAAKNCLRLTNSTYQYYFQKALMLARSQDEARG